MRVTTSFTGLDSQIEIINVTEGENLTATCNLTGQRIIWQTPNGEEVGKQLNLTNITRKMYGLYGCSSEALKYTRPGLTGDRYDKDQLNINSFFLDVLCKFIPIFINWFIFSKISILYFYLSLTNFLTKFLFTVNSKSMSHLNDRNVPHQHTLLFA